jgi:hypothetical protein
MLYYQLTRQLLLLVTGDRSCYRVVLSLYAICSALSIALDLCSLGLSLARCVFFLSAVGPRLCACGVADGFDDVALDGVVLPSGFAGEEGMLAI